MIRKWRSTVHFFHVLWPIISVQLLFAAISAQFLENPWFVPLICKSIYKPYLGFCSAATRCDVVEGRKYSTQIFWQQDLCRFLSIRSDDRDSKFVSFLGLRRINFLFMRYWLYNEIEENALLCLLRYVEEGSLRSWLGIRKKRSCLRAHSALFEVLEGNDVIEGLTRTLWGRRAHFY